MFGEVQVTDLMVSHIFSDLAVIMGFHESLYNDLTAVTDTTGYHTGHVFTVMAPFLKTYSRYCNNFNNSLNALSELKKIPEYCDEIAVASC